jgi:hypothetical protein
MDDLMPPYGYKSQRACSEIQMADGAGVHEDTL